MRELVIFGAGQIAEVAHYYFTAEGARPVAAFTVDAQFRQAGAVLGVPFHLDMTTEEIDRVCAVLRQELARCC